MRSLAWTLIIVGLFGCGQAQQATKTAQATTQPAISIPPEVETLFERGEIAKAVEVLTTLIEKSPKDYSLYTLRATGCHRLGHYASAIENLDQAIALNATDASLYNNRGFIRMGLEQFKEAMADFDKATELAPQYMNAYNNRGLLYIAQGKYDLAIEQFNKAIVIDNQYVDAFNNRGFAEYESDKIGAALEDFNIAIQLNPDYVNAYNNRGLLRARIGDYENAVIDFTQAMMIDSFNPKYYEHRRDVYLKQSAFDKALLDDKKIAWLVEYHQLTADIAASKNPAAKLTQRAVHYMNVSKLDKALDDLDRALTLDPKSINALVTRANVHLQQKKIDLAMADAEACLAIAEKDDAYSVLGDVYLSQGNYDKAIENFARARRIDSNVADAYYGKSKQLAKDGQEEQAKFNLDQALALDPDVEDRLR